jgi:choline dehydrogenase
LLLRRRGPLTSNVGEGGAHLRSDDALDLPDLQQVFAPVMYLEHGLIKPPGHGYTLGTMLVDVTSRGRVWLRTADPNQPPAMVANYVTEPEDMAALVRGVRKAMAIGRLEPLARHATGEHAMPASDSDEDIRAHIRATAFGLYHPVGTCAMGPAGPDTVVDPELRVHGVEGLRVVDASVMPRITRGNTNAPTIMIAEKASDLIRGEAPLGVRASAAG